MRDAKRRLLSSVCVLVGSALPAFAVPIELVDYDTISGNTLVDFQEFPGGFPGTNVDGILTSAGVRFAERFAGQILSEAPPASPGSGPFDILSGDATGPLSLEAGLLGQNLGVSGDPVFVDDRFISGNGPLGFPDPFAIGNGSVAMLFPIPQSELGLRIFGADLGTATLDFFRADGSRIDTIELTSLAFDGKFGFRREGGEADIAGISIFNSDPGGIGFTEILIRDVPEPNIVYLLTTGLLLAHRARRKRTS